MAVKIITRSQGQTHIKVLDSRKAGASSTLSANDPIAAPPPAPTEPAADQAFIPPGPPTRNTWDGGRDPLVVRRAPATLATVLAAVDESAEPPRRKCDIRWGINTFARGTGRTPSDILADAPSVRGELASMSPAMLGLKTEAALHNLTSLLRKGLRMVGRPVLPHGRTEPLTGLWPALYERLPGRSAKARLGPFLSWLSENRYEPEDVSDGHVVRFAHNLEADSLDAQWQKKIHLAVNAWNKAATEIAQWPKNHIRTPWKSKEVFTPALAALPHLYQDSVRDYLGYCQNPPDDDEQAPRKGLREGSLRTRVFLLRYMAAILLQAGWPGDALTSVNDLVEPDALDVLLKYKAPAPDGTGRAQYLVRIVVLKSIAKYWAAAPDEVVKSLSRIINRHSKKSHSMAPSNRRKLIMLSGSEVRAKLFTLAPRVYEALERVPAGSLKARDASLALAALYVEMSIMWPGRVGTLSKIHLTRNLIRSGHGRLERMFLHFQESEIKNGVPVDVELPPHLVALVNLYLTRYRPLLLDGPSEYLFPAKNGGPRSSTTIYHGVTKLTHRYVGVKINPHLFRHLMATIFLEQRPGDYETVRRTLAHTSLDMAHQAYVGVDDRSAVRRFDDVILEAKEEAVALSRRKRARSGGPQEAPRTRTRRSRQS